MYSAPLPRPLPSANTQPTGPVVLNRNHQLAQGLLVSSFISQHDSVVRPKNYVNGTFGRGAAVMTAPVVPFNGSISSVGWLQPGPGNAWPGAQPYPAIGGAYFNGTTSWAQFALDLSPYQQVTVAFWFYRITSTDTIAIEYGPNFNPNGFLIDPQGGSGTMFYAANSTNTRFTSLNSQITANQWHHHVFVVDRSLGAGLNYWQIDGTLAQVSGSGTLITTGVNMVANGNLNIGARNAGTSGFGEFRIAALHVYNYLMPVRLAQLLHKDSWAMYRPTTLVPIFPSAGTLKTYNTVARANVKTFNGTATGSLKNYDSLTWN